MAKIYEEFQILYDEKFYAPSFQEWREDGKTAKDVTGKHFQIFNEELYGSHDVPLIKKTKNIMGSGVNPDLVVGKDLDNILVIEEHKAHYLEFSTFKRAMSDAASIFLFCVKEKKQIPYFVITSTTRFKGYEKCFNLLIEQYHPIIQELIRNYMLYFPLCDFDRIDDAHYFQTKECSIILNRGLVNERINFITTIKSGMN